MSREHDCVEHSACTNTFGGHQCGECFDGFFGNQTVGCMSYCTDCDKNAQQR